jgi:hypothetical protein
MSKEDNSQTGENPFIERRSGGERRGHNERRGPVRWDPRNEDRRNGGDRRRPGYLIDDPDQSDSGTQSDSKGE